ncbi:MAG TPA: hypothetical protein VFY44_06380 [Thermoleophilaceae bacterium]|nr:hypothetical protein [Thermoleophilaceae bacterium]
MKNLNRLVPSPALVIACIALFVAMGGSAYALATGSISGREIRAYTITGKDVKKDGLGGVSIKESRLGTVPSASGLQRSVVVGPLGQFVRGKDVASTGRTANGRYLVTFRSNIQGCAYVASLGDPSVAAPPSGQVSTSGVATNPNQVQVRTTAANGDNSNRPFHLIVSC